jgi:hypothetical protein
MLIDLLWDYVVKSDLQSIEQYVNTLRNAHPILSRREIAQKLLMNKHSTMVSSEQ